MLAMSNDYNPNHVGEKVHAQVGVKTIIFGLDNRFLLLKRSDKMKRQGGKWSLPGGVVEQFENPKDAVVREIREETELEVANVRPFETTGHEYQGDFVIVIGYTCDTKNSTIVLNWEHSEYAWVTRDEALAMDLTGLVRSFIEQMPIK